MKTTKTIVFEQIVVLGQFGIISSEDVIVDVRPSKGRKL
jgi:hypothetical protein